MQPLGRSLIIFGLMLAAVGLALTVAGRIPFIGRLPGDILVKRENFTFYFPLTTCLVISLVITLILRLFVHK